MIELHNGNLKTLMFKPYVSAKLQDLFIRIAVLKLKAIHNLTNSTNPVLLLAGDLGRCLVFVEKKVPILQSTYNLSRP